MKRRRRSAPPAKRNPAAPAPGPRTTVAAAVSRSYSGPLPPATQLAEYDRVLPGAAERIVSMAEGYAAHQQALEMQAMQQERSDRQWARWIAAVVVFAVLLSCLYALYLGYEDFALSLGSWTIVALAAVFVAGKVPDWVRKKEP